jgi:hypothetical protein
MGKLDLSIGILSWKSAGELRATLETYKKNGLFQMVEDVTVFFNEFDFDDFELMDDYDNLYYVPNEHNIGIGRANLELAHQSESENLLLLEKDFHLIENADTTYNLLKEGIDFLNNGANVVRYRHRLNPGNPHYSFRHRGNELNYYDSEIEATSPHLLDSLHWLNPAVSFPDKVQQIGDSFITTSKWGNWTNNPCMYKREFYIQTVTPFAGDGIALEGNISKWWNRQPYKVVHGPGLFKHVDINKYGG